MKNKILKWLKKEKVERAVKTFIEAFFSYIAVNIASTSLTSKSALYALISGAVASAISVAINFRLNESS